MRNYIYSISDTKGNILYIGKTTGDCKSRFSNHLNKIKNSKHEYITYEDYRRNGIKFDVLYSVNCDNDNFLLDLVENVCISYYPCRNDIVVNKKHFSKIEWNTSKLMLNNFIENGIIKEENNSVMMN